LGEHTASINSPHLEDPVEWTKAQRRKRADQLKSYGDDYGVTSMTWLEVMVGATNKVNQSQCKTLLDQFDLLYPTADDQQWAMQQLEQFQFTHRIGKEDCLIAAVTYRLQLPLYTHNLKDMTPMIGSLVVKPYP
jgi:hypothetical protein